MTRKLTSDVFGDERRVQIGTLDLFDFDLHLFRFKLLLNLCTDRFDRRAFDADNDARTRRMDYDRHALRMTDDFDLRYVGVFAFGKICNHFADFQIFENETGIFAGIRIPARLPCFVYAETQTDRINFLTHFIFPPFRQRRQ